MPRILEALQQDVSRRPPVAVGASEPPTPAPAVTGTASVAETIEEIPFIEVGGAALEASPTVLASKTRAPLASSAPKASAPAPKTTIRPTALADLAPPARVPPPPPKASTSAVAFQPVHNGSADVPLTQRLVPELIAFHQPDHALSAQYRSVLDHLVATARQCAARVLLLSGVTADAGTTTVLLNLAITHAHDSKQRVLVVDAGVHRPAVSRKLGLPAVPGLREVLTGLVPLHRALQPTGLPNLDALALGEEGECPSLAVRSLGATLQQLRKRYDLILVDAPTWHGGADMLALASACDALFLVLPQSKADAADSKSLLQSVLRQGMRLRGCVLTHSDA